jgi:DNA repair protein RecN (Recombination protein N)
MLSSLRIKNLALVEDLSLDLSSGFSVLTGETGAGKSLLVDALALLLGARGDGDMVRRGEERASVEGVVEGAGADWFSFLKERGFPEEHPTVLRREVTSAARSRAWINGSACTMGDLKDAGRLWMRLTSQHDHQSLLAEERHLALFDEVLGLEPSLGDVVPALREADSALKARRRGEADRERRLEELADQIADLEKLAPKAGEWSQMRADREPLRNAAHLERAFRESADALREALPNVDLAHKALAKALTVWPEASVEHDRLRSALLELEDLQALSQDQAIRWSKEGVERIEALETRLATFEKLARRQRCEPEELPMRLRELKDEQRVLLGGGVPTEALEAALVKAAKRYLDAAQKLHEERAKAIPELESEVHRRLSTLGMKGARIQLRLSIAEESTSPANHQGKAVRVSESGFSSLAIWIESNPGEGFRPLAKIASGGELSRLMLSLMGAGLTLSKDSGTASLTLVLDEVDAGLGGETALHVGHAVAELGKRHQVLTVTHLAQVAARADQHLVLRKETVNGRTRSECLWLKGPDRLREIARLLSGHPDRPEAVEHAKLLLA